MMDQTIEEQSMSTWARQSEEPMRIKSNGNMLRYGQNRLKWNHLEISNKRYCEDKALIHYSNLQKILGKDVDSGIRTFGWSLSGGMDLDGNKYPDVLVGAYESSNAVYIRSAPVVHLDSKVHDRNTSKSTT